MASYFSVGAGSLTALLAGVLLASSAQADGWIFRPAFGLDQRFDDNFSLVPVGEDAISATRLITDLRLSRETPIFSFQGIARADLRLELGDTENSDTQSNRLLLIDIERRAKRARFGLDVRAVLDTPSRDIVSDVTDVGDVAVDSGVVTQSFDVERFRREFSPSFQYDLSRRSSIEGGVKYSAIEHEIPSVQDTLFTQYLGLLTSGGENPPTPETRPELFDENGEIFTRETVSTDQTGVFSPSGELDDYTDVSVDLSYRFNLSRTASLSASVGYSVLTAQEEVDASALTFEDLTFNPDAPEIRRAPRRESVDTTTRFVLGYQRALTQTLNAGVQVGAYTNTSDNTALFRRADGTSSTDQPTKTDDQGWLASISLDKDSGLTKYSLRFAVDVLPSSAGSRVETNELVGQVFRTITPRLDVSLRGQAYEPDRLGTQSEDRFSRRFISLEPRLIWQFQRDWTLGVSYRYRRQKARVDTESSESNAVLLSVRYVPPSKIRDRNQGF
jgi:hypothetical protein